MVKEQSLGHPAGQRGVGPGSVVSQSSRADLRSLSILSLLPQGPQVPSVKTASVRSGQVLKLPLVLKPVFFRPERKAL